MTNNEGSFRLFRPDLENPTLEDALPAFTSVNVIPVPWVEPDDISGDQGSGSLRIYLV